MKTEKYSFEKLWITKMKNLGILILLHLYQKGVIARV